LAAISSIRLFEAEPDLVRYLSPEDARVARQTWLPQVELAPGDPDIRRLLSSRRAFSAIVLDGMLLQSLRLGEHAGLRLIGPGDMLSLTETPASMLVLESTCRVTSPSRIALLGREMLLACRRWPWLIAGLHARMAEQSERLTTQLMICQLPRVDDRLLSMMWLLAESWGQVTSGGTVLPLELTHSALGGLIGARRPTVTLALSELAERGAVVRQADGWLLLEEPKSPRRAEADAIGEPRLLAQAAELWRESPEIAGEQRVVSSHAELRQNIARLRAEQAIQVEEARERLRQMVASRERVLRLSQRLTRRPPPPRRAPSS
jgi:CRP-like cAMP-binding protein